jgi:predicted dehydrogenase
LKSAVLVIEFADGSRFLVTDTLTGFGSTLQVSIAGTEGAVLGLDRSDSDKIIPREIWLQLKTRNGQGSYESGFPEVDEEVAPELQDFARCVRGEKEPSIPIEDGFASVSICISAIRSMRSGNYETIERKSD